VSFVSINEFNSWLLYVWKIPTKSFWLTQLEKHVLPWNMLCGVFSYVHTYLHFVHKMKYIHRYIYIYTYGTTVFRTYAFMLCYEIGTRVTGMFWESLPPWSVFATYVCIEQNHQNILFLELSKLDKKVLTYTHLIKK
jgi:hypothetical protein